MGAEPGKCTWLSTHLPRHEGAQPLRTTSRARRLAVAFAVVARRLAGLCSDCSSVPSFLVASALTWAASRIPGVRRMLGVKAVSRAPAEEPEGGLRLAMVGA